jgi:nitroreductase
MPGNPVLDAIRHRRSIRKFTDQDVSRREVKAVLEAGRWAPSGLNNQPWRFLVIRRGDPRQAAVAGLTKYGHVVERAATLICVFLDKDAVYSPMKDHQSAGAVIQNMLLAAHSLDLGAVWLGEIVNRGDEVVRALDLPDTLELQAVIALGRPDQKGSSKRKELGDLMLEDF